MTANAYDILIVIAAAVCTILIRALPFAVFGRKDTMPTAVSYLGKVLPASVIAVLVLYCLKNISFEETKLFIPQLVSVVVVALLHIWKRNNLISIGMGTLCYMLLIRVM